jgi:hypothetical protein
MLYQKIRKSILSEKREARKNSAQFQFENTFVSKIASKCLTTFSTPEYTHSKDHTGSSIHLMLFDSSHLSLLSSKHIFSMKRTSEAMAMVSDRSQHCPKVNKYISLTL